jgi:signal transduction histidine kinase
MPPVDAFANSPVLDGERSALRLVKAVQDLSLARDLETVIDIVRHAARELCRTDGASFILREGKCCYYVNEDAIGPLWKGQRFPLTDCISGWAMTHRRATAIKDIYADERIPHDAYRPTFVKSLVMVPIRAENPIGAIGIYWSERHAATDTEIELLQALANSTSVAMENVMLYQDLERRVAERTEQLAQANHELETFAYSVSHDLQAPLRHITSYSELLAEDHSGALSEESRAWLGRIHHAAATMAQLIQSLLRLSRFTSVALHRTRVDLSAIARAQIALLREESPARVAEVEIPDRLEIHGDKELLSIALQNLLANAWKFTSRCPVARITLGTAQQPDGSLVYFVRDNGAGFDSSCADRLFGPFQRLHSVKDFPGTGIGLATVKRIIHRHGGTVWAESAVNEGATFYFTLAKADPASSAGQIV